MNPPSSIPASVDEHTTDDAVLLRAYLTGRDSPCPQCGYNLRDLTGNRCPECGDELVLRLQLSEPKQAAALAGLIALSAGAGFNGLFLCWGFIYIVILRKSMGNSRPVIILTLELLPMGLLVALWLRYWRQVRQLGKIRRWLLAAGCAALSLASVVIFFKLI